MRAVQRGRIAVSCCFIVTIFLAAAPFAPVAAEGPFDKINHVIVLYQENWSFDGLYGKFPGANGIANAGGAAIQVDQTGKPYPTLPQPLDNTKDPAVPDTRIPATLPNGPFDLAPYVPVTGMTGDPVHRFYQEQYQIDGGKMDKFVAWSDAGGYTMSYYDATNLPEGKLAQQYTLADNFFHAAYGGTFLNHFWMACACVPEWKNAPAKARVQFNVKGIMTQDGIVTPDGYVVNQVQPIAQPHPKTADPDLLLPYQTMPTIGDRLTEKGVSWAWYSEGWSDAVAGRPGVKVSDYRQPFMYFQNYAEGTAARAAHLKDEKDFLTALQTNDLPAVSWVKPANGDDEHPGASPLLQGQQYVAGLVQAVQRSPYWKDTAIVITYDEHGGRWDHVAPPAGDRWGPGGRVPTIVISPFARRGFIDHTQYETSSILKTIETRWGIAPLGARDAAATDLRNAFDFSQAAAPATPTTSAPAAPSAPSPGTLLYPPYFVRRLGDG